ncbi:hypothetical protein N1851_034256 [Merluccius polli]|uniref:Reverse transcriptase domain-containing protein n=1 Tax=Merluccius polli TaxID=89951 RepID=A0AA47NLU6_MERPO|nr:hypothetical protein N1851_034256 [Merluccius polli]
MLTWQVWIPETSLSSAPVLFPSLPFKTCKCLQGFDSRATKDNMQAELKSFALQWNRLKASPLAEYKARTVEDGSGVDPCYRANRSVDNAVNMTLHSILQHLESSGTYARILFVDFSFAFNTIMLSNTLLHDKLSQLHVLEPTCRWITDFLSDSEAGQTRLTLDPSAPVPHKAAFFPLCSSPCKPTAAPPVTNPSGP